MICQNGEYEKFGGTSGTTPLVTGSLAGFVALASFFSKKDPGQAKSPYSQQLKHQEISASVFLPLSLRLFPRGI